MGTTHLKSTTTTMKTIPLDVGAPVRFLSLIRAGILTLIAILAGSQLPPRCSRPLPPFQPAPTPCPQMLIIPVSIR
jgi:hypothetical protein